MTNQNSKHNAEEAAQILKNAEALLITAGAGMGVDSGLPDFRGSEGFWKAYPVARKMGVSFAELANPYWFEINPKLAWAFYGHRLHMYRNTEPHKGFELLLDQAQSGSGGYFVFTSNVDGQFQKAGFSEERIEECHGSIHYMQCTAPCSDYVFKADHISINIDEDKFEALEPLPRCPNCGAIARPNILMFGDWHWIGDRYHDQQMALQNWLDRLQREAIPLAIIECGAGTALPTVRHFSEQVAARHRTRLIRINPRDAHTPPGHISIATGAAEGIRTICGAM